ncbi:MAG: hypothetical protein KatS3mg077_2876 [Candidatus Binatia bacterium]|nr:MAG: hypothetical protein KatS3mg077_2876 [Candidatus Binatia bacterium]
MTLMDSVHTLPILDRLVALIQAGARGELVPLERLHGIPQLPSLNTLLPKQHTQWRIS